MNKITFDYTLLNELIFRVYGNVSKCANALGLSRASLCNKLKGKTTFTQEDIVRLSAVLGIENVTPYFFTINE